MGPSVIAYQTDRINGDQHIIWTKLVSSVTGFQKLCHSTNHPSSSSTNISKDARQAEKPESENLRLEEKRSRVFEERRLLLGWNSLEKGDSIPTPARLLPTPIDLT